MRWFAALGAAIMVAPGWARADDVELIDLTAVEVEPGQPAGPVSHGHRAVQNLVTAHPENGQ